MRTIHPLYPSPIINQFGLLKRSTQPGFVLSAQRAALQGGEAFFPILI